MFKKIKAAMGSVWTPPKGFAPQRQELIRSVPFTFDSKGSPFFSAASVVAHDKGGPISLKKGFDAAMEALASVDMAGLRANVIVIVDDSGSMKDDYRDGLVDLLLVRSLGFGLCVDRKIDVLTYGRPNEVVTITADNYLQAPQLLPPTFGGTPMAAAYRRALELAAESGQFSIIVNLTDGDPDNEVAMTSEVVSGSGHPDLLKNLALKDVPYLATIDNMPSRYEIAKWPGTDQPQLDERGRLIIAQNPEGLRLVDNVDSQSLDPRTATDYEFAVALADEIPTYLEVGGRVGLLTGVPGVDRTFF